MEFDTEFDIVVPEVFSYYLKKNKRIEFFTIYPEEVLRGWKLFLTKAKESGAGFALTSGNDLVNLFNNTGIKGLGGIMVRCAIDLGARRVFCFDGYLYSFYASFGFRVVRAIPWNDRLAPKNWDYGKYGKPDVLYMEQ